MTGSAISWDGDFNVHTEGEVFASVIDLVLNCGCFIYIGAWLPFHAFSIPELEITPWRLVVLTIGVLVLRRIPAILLLFKWIPEIKSWREALFCGHFGELHPRSLHLVSKYQHCVQVQYVVLRMSYWPLTNIF